MNPETRPKRNLPKSFGSLVHLSGVRDPETISRVKGLIQDDLDKIHNDLVAAQHHGQQQRTHTFNSQIQQLRSEMVHVRHTDMVLLKHLWTLNEAIQDYKTLLHRIDDGGSMASSIPSYDNILEDDLAPPAALCNGCHESDA